MTSSSGERQIGKRLDDIAPDHVARYHWAARMLHIKLDRKVFGPPRILDAACGCGYGSEVLAQSGFKVTGVDISPEAKAYARHFGAGRDWDFLQHDILNLGHLGKFDAVVSIETVEHINQDGFWVTHMHRLADLAVVTVPNQLVTPFTPNQFKHHFRHYTPDQLGGLFRARDWNIEENDWWTQKGTKWKGTDMSPGKGGRVLGIIASGA